MQGYNSTIFAYGQTGSGKTYTLFGPRIQNREMEGNKEDGGMLSRVINEIFNELKQRNEIKVFIRIIE